MRVDTLIEGMIIAWAAMKANKIRAALTILGVSIGVAVVVTMAAVITGIKTSIADSLTASGPRNFIVMPFDITGVRISDDRPPWWYNPEITDAEVRRVGTLPAIKSATAALTFQATFTRGSERMSGVESRGFSSDWPDYTVGEFTGGRNFGTVEADEGRPVVVLSDGLAEELFGLEDPVGKTVRAGSGWRGVSERFTVIGVYTPEENIFGNLAPNWAVFPYVTATRRLKARNPFSFAQILVVPQDTVAVAAAEDQVIGALRSMRKLEPAAENNFAIMRPTQLLEIFNRFTSVFFAVMLALSSVGLLVGGVGVIGIMLISVTERTREIGVRKALGATRREILWQFLVESGAMTLMGGAFGLTLGGLAAWGVARFTPIPAVIPLWSIAAALVAAALTGIVFGLIPALRASRLDPVAALRYE